MNYGDLQTQVMTLLNRRDNTTALTQAFIQSALQRCQRTLRIPAMEKSIVATIGDIFSGGLAVPGDLLQFIALTNPATGKELVRTTLPKVLHLQINDQSGCARYFCRQGSRYQIGPLPLSGDTLRMDYYASLLPLVNSADTNVLTDIAPDLLWHGALEFGASYFNDKRKADFEADYKSAFDDLTAQANQDELTGNACVAPYLHFDEE